MMNTHFWKLYHLNDNHKILRYGLNLVEPKRKLILSILIIRSTELKNSQLSHFHFLELNDT